MWHRIAFKSPLEGFKKVDFVVKDPVSGEKVAEVVIKIFTYPFKYILISNIEVVEDEKKTFRGLSSDDESGYGGTIVRLINEKLSQPRYRYFAILSNQTEIHNQDRKRVIDFYLKHQWRYLYPEDAEANKYMYFAPNVNCIEPSKFQLIRKMYTD